MRLMRFSIVVLAALLWVSDKTSFAGDLKEPLPVDPSVKMGLLENGMTYWIRKHATPPEKVSMWLHIHSGSLNEEDDQQGLAHYLEHMAFNGSKHFPPGTLVKFFESLGMRFGADQNAFTNTDQTTYIMSLPDSQEDTLTKGFQYLSDVAFRLTLSSEEIDKERKVILEESRSRKGVNQRLYEKMMPIILPDSRISKRMPIGKEEVISKATKENFDAYYGKWYHPANCTLLVVGDADPARIEAFIKKHFSEWAAKKEIPKPFDPGIKQYTSTRSAVITDPELAKTSVSFARVLPMVELQNTGDFRARSLRDMALWIMNRRFSELVKSGKAPFQNASVSIFPYQNVCTYAGGSASGEAEDWEQMMQVVLTEVKRAREYGFLDQELEDARKAIWSSAEHAVQMEATLSAHAFLGSMNANLSANTKPMAATQIMVLLKHLLQDISVKEVSDSFKSFFAPENMLLLVEMPEKEGLVQPAPEKIIEVANRAEGSTVTATVARNRPKNLLSYEPQPAFIKDQKFDKDLEILSLTFENGVIAHFRSMDYKKDQVSVSITLGGGEISESEGNRGFTSVAALAFQQKASRTLSSIDIDRIMTGSKVAVQGGNDRDSLKLTVAGSPKDLEQGLQLAHLLLTAPQIEDSALKLWRQGQLQALERRRTSTGAQMGAQWQAILYADDVRVKDLTKAQIEAVTLEKAQVWLDDLVATAPIEISVVGDIPTIVSLELIRKYMGSLPDRTVRFGDLDKLRKLKHEKGPHKATLQVPTITPKAEVLAGWRGADIKDVEDVRGLQVASQILQGRLRDEIREKRGLTYSTGCWVSPGVAYQDSGFIAAYFTADPDKVEGAANIAREVMEKFAQEGPTPEEMATVHKQLQVSIRDSQQTPEYWSEILSSMVYRKRNLKDVKEALEIMSNYSREDVIKVLRKYFQDARYQQVLSVPVKSKGTAEDTGKEKTAQSAN